MIMTNDKKIPMDKETSISEKKKKLVQNVLDYKRL